MLQAMLIRMCFVYSCTPRFGITILVLEIRKNVRTEGAQVHPSHILMPLPRALASYSLTFAAFSGEDCVIAFHLSIPGPADYLGGILAL